MLSHGFECKGSTCSRICALGCLVVWSAFGLSALPRNRDLPASSTGAGVESRRELSPLFPFLHECRLLTVLYTPLSALLCALTNNFLPLVMGGTLYFEECWGGLGYFITVLGSWEARRVALHLWSFLVPGLPPVRHRRAMCLQPCSFLLVQSA